MKPQIKDRIKAVKDGQKERLKFQKEISNLKGKEKIENKIKILESRIKNCEYDLKIFENNDIIKNKILSMKEEIEKLKFKLKEIENG